MESPGGMSSPGDLKSYHNCALCFREPRETENEAAGACSMGRQKNSNSRPPLASASRLTLAFRE